MKFNYVLSTLILFSMATIKPMEKENLDQEMESTQGTDYCICLEPQADKEFITFLCGHKNGHKRCLEQWFKLKVQNNQTLSCLICAQKLTEQDLEQLNLKFNFTDIYQMIINSIASHVIEHRNEFNQCMQPLLANESYIHLLNLCSESLGNSYNNYIDRIRTIFPITQSDIDNHVLIDKLTVLFPQPMFEQSIQLCILLLRTINPDPMIALTTLKALISRYLTREADDNFDSFLEMVEPLVRASDSLIPITELLSQNQLFIILIKLSQLKLEQTLPIYASIINNFFPLRYYENLKIPLLMLTHMLRVKLTPEQMLKAINCFFPIKLNERAIKKTVRALLKVNVSLKRLEKTITKLLALNPEIELKYLKFNELILSQSLDNTSKDYNKLKVVQFKRTIEHQFNFLMQQVHRQNMMTVVYTFALCALIWGLYNT